MKFAVTYTGILAANGGQHTIGTSITSAKEIAEQNIGVSAEDVTLAWFKEELNDQLLRAFPEGSIQLETGMNGTAHIRCAAWAVIYAEVEVIN